jgi:hypothetical protein
MFCCSPAFCKKQSPQPARLGAFESLKPSGWQPTAISRQLLSSKKASAQQKLFDTSVVTTVF